MPSSLLSREHCIAHWRDAGWLARFHLFGEVRDVKAGNCERETDFLNENCPGCVCSVPDENSQRLRYGFTLLMQNQF